MFKLEKPDTVIWPVKVGIPANGGKTTRASFDAEFKLLDQGELDSAVSDAEDDQVFLCSVVVDWTGVQDENGHALPYSHDACKKMVAIPYVRRALITAFWAAQTGATEKN